MEGTILPLAQLKKSTWSPNEMTAEMLVKLHESITRFGIVENLVVRPMSEGTYEVLSGNHRLEVYGELGLEMVPCVVVHLDDVKARLLAQVLNRTRGEDNLGLKAKLIRSLLDSLPDQEVLALLPETASSLQDLSSLGMESMAQALEKWQQAQQARLHHLTLQLTRDQLQVVEQVLEMLLPLTKEEQGNPNRRGTALYLLCLGYLERGSGLESPTWQEEKL